MKNMCLPHQLRLWSLLFLLSACRQSIHPQGATMQNLLPHEMKPKTQSISVEGMTVSWHFAEEFIYITASAPTRGWVAVGFNQRDDIVGANLIIGAVLPQAQEDNVKIEDHFVLRLGEHLPVATIGGTTAITALGGKEEGEQTTLHFRLPTRAIDRYHLDLQPGMSLYLIVAYSIDDDFAHHSRMRQHVRVTL